MQHTFCSSVVKNLNQQFEKKAATINQVNLPLWYELRYDRITASRAHEVSKCKTPDGALVEIIMGAAKFKDTPAMASHRGRSLEDDVRCEIQKIKNLNIRKCGLILNRNVPVMGASPDGITDEYVIDIKCLQKEKSLSNYVSLDGIIAPKYYT